MEVDSNATSEDERNDAIKISRQCIILIEDYRYLLSRYQESCGCHIHFDNQFFYRKMEEKHAILSAACASNEFLRDALDDNNDAENLAKLVKVAEKPKDSKNDETLVAEVPRKRITLSTKLSPLKEPPREDRVVQARQNLESLRGEKIAFKCTYANCDHIAFTSNQMTAHFLTHADATEIPVTIKPPSNSKPEQGTSGTGGGEKVQDDLSKQEPAVKPVFYICEQCGQEFLSPRDLYFHTVRHGASKAFVCNHPACGFTTAYRCVIDDHKRRHSTTKDFKCTQCDTLFVTRRDLTAHIKYSHENIRKFACQWENCTSSFKDRNRLRHHMFTHTGERPYRCEVVGCGASFKQLSHLNKHRATHDPDEEILHPANKMFRKK